MEQSKSVTISARVDSIFKQRLEEQADLCGMKLSLFIQKSLQEKLDNDPKISLSNAMANQIAILKQVVFHGYGWKEDQELIQREVQRLCQMIEKNSR